MAWRGGWGEGRRNRRGRRVKPRRTRGRTTAEGAQDPGEGSPCHMSLLPRRPCASGCETAHHVPGRNRGERQRMRVPLSRCRAHATHAAARPRMWTQSRISERLTPPIRRVCGVYSEDRPTYCTANSMGESQRRGPIGSEDGRRAASDSCSENKTTAKKSGFSPCGGTGSGV